MGLGSIINFAVAFCVFVLVWKAFELFVLPSMWGKIGIPALPPAILWKFVYMILSKIGEYLVIAILVVFLILWLVYSIIMMIGIYILLAMFGLWPISLLEAPKKAGIYMLFDSSIGKLIGLTSGGYAPVFPIAFLMFMIRGAEFLAESAGLSGDDLAALKAQNKTTEQNLVQQKKDGTLYSNIQNTQRQREIQQKQLQMDDTAQQCLEENLIPITDTMSQSDRLKAQSMNQAANARCSLEQANQGLKTMMSRLSNDEEMKKAISK